MMGSGLQFNRSFNGEDRFYSAAKARRNVNRSFNGEDNLRRAKSDVAVSNFPAKTKMKVAAVDESKKELPVAAAVPTSEVLPLCNLERFLKSVTPSVPAQYLSKAEGLSEITSLALRGRGKVWEHSTHPWPALAGLHLTTIRDWRTCDVEFLPYYVLGDLWESFKEWSAYGAGVPLVLDEGDSAVQYYVPYLSGIQLYGDSSKASVKTRYSARRKFLHDIFFVRISNSSLSAAASVRSFIAFAWAALKPNGGMLSHAYYMKRNNFSHRRPGEESDSDYFRDSSSDGSSDSEHERRCLNYSREQRMYHSQASESSLSIDGLSLRDSNATFQEGFSSDEGESGSSQGALLFEYFAHDQPYGREPLADKISDLAQRFPELKTMRSCDLLHYSWISVAWYPIYRIPTGPTLKALDACFLTFHSLHTPMPGNQSGHTAFVACPTDTDAAPKIPLPAFGLASYKFKASLWTPNGGPGRQLMSSLLQAADNRLTLLQVNHPDFSFFCQR
ncbi:hypothetical protein MTR67_021651 [Solanum verrucosum]|uniref:Uncharacterized protein n=1 Tax=Solanum verrucosum TaxID=315347 RepID=A0AAF0TQ46_SOLVR|nr:hypothetical protein MTR67_021651 [Solanum verrucosum]